MKKKLNKSELLDWLFEAYSTASFSFVPEYWKEDPEIKHQGFRELVELIDQNEYIYEKKK